MDEPTPSPGKRKNSLPPSSPTPEKRTKNNDSSSEDESGSRDALDVPPRKSSPSWRAGNSSSSSSRSSGRRRSTRNQVTSSTSVFQVSLPGQPPSQPLVQPPPKTQAAFVGKLYSMLENPDSTSGMIYWSQDGTSFICPNPQEFAKILPNFFKHNNWQSFVRQLNMYNFHKVTEAYNAAPQDPATWEFRHELFRRGQPQLLVSIKRKSTRNTYQEPIASPTDEHPPDIVTPRAMAGWMSQDPQPYIGFPPREEHSRDRPPEDGRHRYPPPNYPESPYYPQPTHPSPGGEIGSHVAMLEQKVERLSEMLLSERAESGRKFMDLAACVLQLTGGMTDNSGVNVHVLRSVHENLVRFHAENRQKMDAMAASDVLVNLAHNPWQHNSNSNYQYQSRPDIRHLTSNFSDTLPPPRPVTIPASGSSVPRQRREEMPPPRDPRPLEGSSSGMTLVDESEGPKTGLKNLLN